MKEMSMTGAQCLISRFFRDELPQYEDPENLTFNIPQIKLELLREAFKVLDKVCDRVYDDSTYLGDN